MKLRYTHTIYKLGLAGGLDNLYYRCGRSKAAEPHINRDKCIVRLGFFTFIIHYLYLSLNARNGNYRRVLLNRIKHSIFSIVECSRLSLFRTLGGLRTSRLSIQVYPTIKIWNTLFSKKCGTVKNKN